MLGSPETPGIIPLTLEALFEVLSADPETTASVHISYLEVYNENLQDLLDPESSKILQLREGSCSHIFMLILCCRPSKRDCCFKFI